MSAGYVTVDAHAGRALYYILAESVNNSETAPLVLWLNGGPGCSSIGGGYMSELGPFLPLPDGSLKRNLYAWNSIANMIFLDSPAFVGFSYSNSSSDKVVGDARTATDARLFLLGFLKKFPKYADRPLYITGESYAGHYVPNLANEIIRGNAKAKDPQINLKGIMVGNPWTDPAADNYGAAFMWWTHSLISTSTFETLRKTCNMSTIGPIRCSAADALTEGGSPSSTSTSSSSSSSSSVEDQCEDALESAMDEMGNINIYQVYADVCEPKEARALSRHVRKAGLAHRVSTFSARAHSQSLERLRSPAEMLYRRVKGLLIDDSSDSDDSGFPREDACVDEEVVNWLNRKDVQAAFHTIPVEFNICTDDIEYSGEDVITSVLPVYDALLDAGLRILIYSGDVDGIVPTTGTRVWVEGLGLPEIEKWRPWLTPGKGNLPMQVGGYVVAYDGLTFATVRGAGHMVPYVQPERALQLFDAFLRGETPTAAPSPSSEAEALIAAGKARLKVVAGSVKDAVKGHVGSAIGSAVHAVRDRLAGYQPQ